MAMNNCYITIREVADFSKSVGSCHEIFSNVLGINCVAAEFIQKLLNFVQKQWQIEAAQESITETCYNRFTKHGFMDMMLKLRVIHPSGDILNRQDLKKCS
ncbi:hypothetical protein J6590_108375 [Homalodisca vitripennis]|nr:hypothetical protein J6590_108375 [Homalodisca vitripennis]